MAFSMAEQFLLDNTPPEKFTYKFNEGRLAGIEFSINPMNSREFSKYQSLSYKSKKGGKMEMNNEMYNRMIVLNHCSDPNFKNAELVKKAGFLTPEDFLYAKLNAGEVEELSNAILESSGFETGMGGILKEAKKS